MDATANLTATGVDAVLLDEAMRATASALLQTYKSLGSLNGTAPQPEANAVLHLVAQLLQDGFSVYSEAAFKPPGRKRLGRIDMVAANEDVTIVLEAKTMGRRRFDGLLADAERIEAFEPQPDPKSQPSLLPDQGFWRPGQQRFGCLLVQAFAPEEIVAAWQAEVTDEAAFEKALERDIPRFRPPVKDQFRKLAKFLRRRGAHASVALVGNSGGELWKCLPLYLLWATFPLTLER